MNGKGRETDGFHRNSLLLLWGIQGLVHFYGDREDGRGPLREGVPTWKSTDIAVMVLDICHRNQQI